jgi:hypothetical protein
MMKDNKQHTSCSEKIHQVHLDELPLSCPTKDMSVWNAHPKVYLPIEKTGRETCPYCGTEFILKDAKSPA